MQLHTGPPGHLVVMMQHLLVVLLLLLLLLLVDLVLEMLLLPQVHHRSLQVRGLVGPLHSLGSADMVMVEVLLLMLLVLLHLLMVSMLLLLLLLLDHAGDLVPAARSLSGGHHGGRAVAVLHRADVASHGVGGHPHHSVGQGHGGRGRHPFGGGGED